MGSIMLTLSNVPTRLLLTPLRPLGRSAPNLDKPSAGRREEELSDKELVGSWLAEMKLAGT